MSLGVKVYRKDKIKETIINEGSGLYYYFNYPKIFIKNESVKIDKLNGNMLFVLQQLTNVAYKFGLTGFIVTSGNDGSHGGSSGSNSLHYKNRAIDISFREAIKNTIIEGLSNKSSSIINEISFSLTKASGAIDYDVVIESNHIHIEYDPKGKRITEGSAKVTSLTGTSDDESNLSLEFEPIRYCHYNTKITTLSQLLDSNPLFSKYKENQGKLLDYKGKTNTNNRQRIESLYEENDSFDMLKINTVIYLDPEMIDRDSVFKHPVNQIIDTSSFPMFLGKLREDLENDENYIQPDFYRKDNIYPVDYINHLVSVWIYSKALNEIIDITSLCKNVVVNSDLMVSSFSLTCNITPQTEISEQNIVLNTFKNNISFIQRYIGENDIIWIRFEELNNEVDRKQDKISFTEIAGKIYDFMGFVNSVNDDISLGASYGDVSINGQCFSKLFTDDEAVFFPIAAIKDSQTGNLVIGSFENDNLLKRMFADGNYYNLFSKQYRTIKDTLQFYINQLSNTGLIPRKVNDLLFQSYGDRRVKIAKLKGDEVKPDELANGVYQIINILLDDSVKDRTIVDATVTNPQGSILSLFSNICQEPLVEFITDTYGDSYAIIVRKPPFDKESINSFIRSNNAIYNVDSNDVMQESLGFETNFYTWFEIQNRAIFMGTDRNQPLAYVPIVPLNEYIEYWGSKKRYIESNYTRSNDFGIEKERKQVIMDLLYVMECDIYLPFSRRGSIVLSRGDRRIKKGSWIRYKNELFYVDSVVNSVSIEDKTVQRVTTLNVSRGIKEEYIDGRNINGKRMSYFNIVDFESLKQTLLEYVNNDKGSVINRNIIIDSDVFEFFVNKRQFDE